MKAPERILIIRLSSLGDILHTLPAFQDLRRAFPRAHIGWLAEKRSAFLLSAVPGIDALHVIDTRPLRRAPWSLPAWRTLRRTLGAVRGESYDLCLDFQGLLKTGVLSRLSGAGRRLGFSAAMVREKPAHWFYSKALEPTGEVRHVVRLNRMLAAMTGAAETLEKVVLEEGQTDRQAIDSRLAAEQLSRFAVINPGGGWPTKRWPAKLYGRLAERIITKLDLPVVVTTGPGEEGMYEEMAAQCGSRKPVHFHVPFLQLIPLLRRARLMIGGDTGPFHLACALETPVVGIFGPTSTERNGPWTDRDKTVGLLLPCSPCYGRTCPTQNECMDIPVDDVFDAVLRRIENTDELRQMD